MATMGTESKRASASPVTRFVAPGPDVAMQTPTSPVTLPYPSAANISPCSQSMHPVLSWFLIDAGHSQQSNHAHHTNCSLAIKDAKELLNSAASTCSCRHRMLRMVGLRVSAW